MKLLVDTKIEYLQTGKTAKYHASVHASKRLPPPRSLTLFPSKTLIFGWGFKFSELILILESLAPLLAFLFSYLLQSQNTVVTNFDFNPEGHLCRDSAIYADIPVFLFSYVDLQRCRKSASRANVFFLNSLWQVGTFFRARNVLLKYGRFPFILFFLFVDFFSFITNFSFRICII